MTPDSLRAAAQQAADTIRAELELGANGFAADGWLGHLEAAERLLRAALAVPQEGEKPLDSDYRASRDHSAWLLLGRILKARKQQRPGLERRLDQAAEWLSQQHAIPSEFLRGSVPPESAEEPEAEVKAAMVRRMNALHCSLSEIVEAVKAVDFNNQYVMGLSESEMPDFTDLPTENAIDLGMMRRAQHALSEAAFGSSPQPGAEEAR